MHVDVIIPTLVKNADYTLLCTESLRRNTTKFIPSFWLAENGPGSEWPQGQCLSVNRVAELGSAPWIMVTNDDMYYPPSWDRLLGFNFLCFSPNLIEPLGHGSAPPFLQCEAGNSFETFNQKAIDQFVATREPQGHEIGFNLPFIIRRDVWETIGGYDTMYDPWGSNSDSDLQTKLELAGVQTFRDRDSVVYHFANKSGTFDGSHQAEWQRNWDYYVTKWGFDRKDSPDIWYAKDLIDWDKLIWHPYWEGKYVKETHG